MEHFVYILYSPGRDTFYKGQTNDLEDRISRHNHLQEKATKRSAPWIMVWSTCVSSRSDAVILEAKLKNLTRKRLISFMLKYSEDIAGPDEFLLLEKLSGC